MSHLKTSLLRRWHSLTARPEKFRAAWAGRYWQEAEGFRDIACANCRRFSKDAPGGPRCTVGFGTPLRQCVVAAIEAHFHAPATGQSVLEIGFGRFNLAQNLLRRCGATWTGIDPAQPVSHTATLGRGGHGNVAALPFADQTFDQVYGIQTFEHWGQRAHGREPLDYSACLAEVHRVLKPGGRLYLDAPIHFHGHEMFIVGDLPRIQALFASGLWRDVSFERWRLQHAPLEAYPPNRTVLAEWPVEISSYPAAEVERLRASASVWLLTITAWRKG